MPEKLKRILQNKNWRSWKKSDWLLLALAGILLLVIARHRRRESRNMSNIWRRSSRIF